MLNTCAHAAVNFIAADSCLAHMQATTQPIAYAAAAVIALAVAAYIVANLFSR